MLDKLFLSSQVKWSVIISDHMVRYELPNKVGLTILGNEEISKQTQKFVEL